MKKHTYLTIGTWFLLLFLWFMATEWNLVSATLLPKPIDVFRALLDTSNPNIGYNGLPLGQHLMVSFYRLFLAVFFAILTAVPLGLWSGYSSKLRAVIDSIVQFYRPIPPLAYYTLLVLWMGIDDSSKIMLLFLAAFAPIYLSCVSAVSLIPKDYIKNAMCLGASRKQIFFHVVLPASLPQIFMGMRTAVGFAYTTLVSSEMVAAVSGIGWMVLDAHRFLKYDVVFLGVIIMGITGVFIDSILLYLENKLVFWKGKQ